jgi:hypothetical protein
MQAPTHCVFCGVSITGNHICPAMVNPPLLIVMGGRFSMDEFSVNPNLGKAGRVEPRIYVGPVNGELPSC